MLTIRPASPADHKAIWAILEPVLRAGETYALPRDMPRDAALAYWTGQDRATFIAEAEGAILGTYYLKPNQLGGGAHVANCGYISAARGTARAMAEHSFAQARARGFTAMQFNFVIATNTRAIALWESLGFSTLCRLPGAYLHPTAGLTDALVMFRNL
jgi:ribosomal protein S18 acetylase RimI-like enzyme